MALGAARIKRQVKFSESFELQDPQRLRAEVILNALKPMPVLAE